MKTPILGASYVARSVHAANNRMVNLFPEVVPEGGKEPAFLSRTPGLRLLMTVGTGPIRGLWQYGNYGYVVSGNKLYRLDSTWSSTELGTVSGNGSVSMSDNGIQLFVACNPDGFIYNVNTNVFSEITDPDFPGAVTVDYMDGYFVFNQPDSQLLWVTSLLNGLAVDPLEFTSAEASPDNIVGGITNSQEYWVFGTNTTQVYYDAALPDFPLDTIKGVLIETGCKAAFTIVKLDNSIFWLGNDKNGSGMIYRSSGYSAQRISDHALEWQIQRYPSISDAVAYSYQQDGHLFYVITFPSGNATWVYDVATSKWHERAGFSNGQFCRHRSNRQMHFNDEIVVGDYENGNLYAIDSSVYTDNGSVLKWLRSWRALSPGQNDLLRTTHHSLQLDCETGVGITTGQGEDPKVMLRFSDTSGKTWSNELWRSLGREGDFNRRVYWKRLGNTKKLRDRVYEISGTDPVKMNIAGAELIASKANG